MGTLIYFVVFAGLFFLMMRYGCGAHVMGHGHSHHGQEGAQDGGNSLAPRETAIDPVCGMSVQTGSSKSSVYKGTAYYFCSVEHRDAFEADPERYLVSKVGAGLELAEHHHG